MRTRLLICGLQILRNPTLIIAISSAHAHSLLDYTSTTVPTTSIYEQPMQMMLHDLVAGHKRRAIVLRLFVQTSALDKSVF